jgi:hypothetical protein
MRFHFGMTPYPVPTLPLVTPTRFILPAELRLLAIVLSIGLGAVLLGNGMGRDIHWPPFLIGFAATMALLGVGGYVRAVKAAPRLALALIGFAVYMSFTLVAGLFIFVLLPLPNPLQDAQLIALDAALGYDWADFVTWLADRPLFAQTLGYLYRSSLSQLLIVIIVLSACSRQVDLHRFLLTGMLTMIVTVSIWWFWPSIGPAGSMELPLHVHDATNLFSRPGYGTHLKDLIEQGPATITPDVIIGIVAFPSYHMIMACLVVWYSYRTVLFYPALVVGAGMIPATLSHGGHHLIDLFAAVVVFLFGAWVSASLIRHPDTQDD